MISEYRQRVFILHQNLQLFKKSAHLCNIQDMLENNMLFIETLKRTDDLFVKLSPNEKKDEKETFDKSRFLVQQYFNIKGDVVKNCECISR